MYVIHLFTVTRMIRLGPEVYTLQWRKEGAPLIIPMRHLALSMILVCSAVYATVVIAVLRMFAEESTPYWIAQDVSGRTMTRVLITPPSPPPKVIDQVPNEVVHLAAHRAPALRQEAEARPLMERPLSAGQ
jgi:hypothetical protein